MDGENGEEVIERGTEFNIYTRIKVRNKEQRDIKVVGDCSRVKGR